LGVRRDREIGVDIEHIRPEFASYEVAEHHFSPHEVQEFKKISKEKKIKTFFAIWTRKEAFIKAVGKGVSFGLEKFEVSVDPNQPAKLVAVDDEVEKAAQWYLKNIDTDVQYPAAFATFKPVSNIESFEFSF